MREHPKLITSLKPRIILDVYGQFTIQLCIGRLSNIASLLFTLRLKKTLLHKAPHLWLESTTEDPLTPLHPTIAT